MFSIPTKCFSCNITAPMRAVATGFQCQSLRCGRVYPYTLYKIKEETKRGRQKRLASKIPLTPHRVEHFAEEVFVHD